MGTKLKRYNIWLKVFSLVVFITAATISVTIIAGIKKADHESNYDLDDIFYDDYEETDYFNNEVSRAENEIRDLHSLYTDKDFAIAQVSDKSNEEILEKFHHETNYMYEGEVYSNGSFNDFEYANSEARSAMYEFQITYSAEINEIVENNIENKIKSKSNYIEDSFSGGLVYFFATPDGYIVTNTSFATVEDFEEAYSTLSDGDLNPSYNDYTGYQFAFKEDYLVSEFAIPHQAFSESFNQNTRLTLVVSILLVIPSFGYILYAAGRKNSNQVNMLKVDKLYVDFNVALLASMAFTLLASIVLIDDGMIYRLSPLVFCIEIAIILGLLLSLVRHFKNKTILKHVFMRKVVKSRLIRFKDLIAKPTTNRISLIIVIAYGILAMFIGFIHLTSLMSGRFPYYGHFMLLIVFYGFLIASPIIAYLLYKHIKAFEKLSEGAKKIKSGKYDEKIGVNFTKEYREFADNLNDISSGLSDEVERRLKSERMKTDLITNVSHDLKTPLTSFITYVDLLKKENIEDEKIQGYIEVLDQKSARLKVLVDDLVDSAKASSGTVQVSLDKVDVNALISQSLGELNDVISKSNLDFRLKQPTAKLYVFADGKLLSRVVNNLIDNALKYSLPNTRVYINILEQDDSVLLEFKNISADELNISEDELMDRFVRGDKSRNTKGSGLGLNIAKSLVAAQNGELSISIDGDAFTAVVKMNKYNE